MPARLTTAQRLHRAMSERALQETVEGYLVAGRWRWYHAPDNRPITAASGRRYVQSIRRGFPDLVALRPGRSLALELKREVHSDATDEQLAWLADFAARGWEVGVFRPSDLPTLEAALIRGAPLPAWPATR